MRKAILVMGLARISVTNLLKQDLSRAQSIIGRCKITARQHVYMDMDTDGRLRCPYCNDRISDQSIPKELLPVQNQQVDESGLSIRSDEDKFLDRGISLAFLRDFCQSFGLWNKSTREVRAQYVIPLTMEARCCFVDLPSIRAIGAVGRAVCFVSHSWEGSFGDLVAAVDMTGCDSDRAVWIDIFSARQWPAVDPSRSPDLTQSLDLVISRCSSFLLVCSPSASNSNSSSSNNNNNNNNNLT